MAADDLILRVDVNADPAYAKLTKLRQAITATQAQIEKDAQRFKADGTGGLSAAQFKAQYGVIKKNRQQLYSDLSDLDKGYANKQKNMFASSLVNATMREQEKAAKDAAVANQSLGDSLRGAGINADMGGASLVRLRYAMYDVASGAQQAAQAINTFNTATIGAAIEYEKAFTPLQRATQIDINTAGGRAELDALKQQLLDLSTVLPNTFQDLSGVAALGSALGIANDDLIAFTDTVVKFSSASNVSIDGAAQAFGALGELLDVSASEYENLGSAIAYVGINSNATESQIIAVAEAIAGVTATANISAQDTVGLAGALASLKVPAEQSRGALTRIFAEVNRASAEGGQQLQEFATVLGTTTDGVKQLAATDMAGFLLQLSAGLSGMTSEQITGTLDALNLADIRVTNTLSRLAGNLDTTRSSMQMANAAYAEGSFLSEAYATVQEDVATRIAELVNAFNNLLASFGEPLLMVIGPLVDALKEITVWLEKITETGAGKVFTAMIGVLSLLAGGFFAVVAAVVPLGAGILAFRVALDEMQKSGNRTLVGIADMAASMTGLSSQTNGATISVLGFNKAVNGSVASSVLFTGSLQQQRAALALNNAQIHLNNVAGQGMNAQIGARIGLLKAQAAQWWANVAAMTAMQRVSMALGWVGIIGAAVGVVATMWSALSSSIKTDMERQKELAEEWFGSASTLADAMKQDTAAGASTISIGIDSETVTSLAAAADAQQKIAEGQAKVIESSEIVAGGYDKVSSSIENSKEKVDESTTALDRYIEATSRAIDGVDALGKTIEVAWGDAAKKALADSLAANTAFQDIISSDVIEKIGGTDVDLVAAILGDPTVGAQNYISKLIDGMGLNGEDIWNSIGSGNWRASQAAIAQLAIEFDMTTAEAEAFYEELSAIKTAQDASTGAIREGAVALQGQQVAAEGLTKATNGMTMAQMEAEKAASDYISQLELMQSANDAVDSLSTSIQENGTAFAGAVNDSFNYSQAAINNSIALGEAIKQVSEAAAAAGYSATEAATMGVAQMFATMVANGVEAANAISAISAAGYGQFTGGLQTAISGQYAGLTQAFNAVSKSASKAGAAIGGTTAKVRTLIDYANDLKNVFSRAFEIRFSAQSALDKITSTWIDMREAVEDAHEEIADIRNELQKLDADIQKLTADRALQEYFLSVAEAYGDALRAQEIRANIADIDSRLTDARADLASANNNLTKAQSKTNKTLVGNSKEAIANRAEILDLVSGYQDYIQALAASGASQETLRAATAQARADFMAQATQLGFNSAQLETYAVAFDDVTSAINRVPRNITVAANTDPAIQALNELNARANSATAPRTATIGTSVDYAGLAKFARGVEIARRLSEIQYSIRSGDDARFYAGTIAHLKWQLNSGNFATGGYVSGPGTSMSDSIPANLSNGEYVIRASAVDKYGVAFFDRLNQMRAPQYFSGASAASAPTSMMVELSPADRALLRSVGGSGEVVLYANNEAIARSANEGNKNIVAMGGRP